MDILIFDMDGVLIDVSKSYRDSIKKTVHIYLETCLGFENGVANLVTEEDISLFKTISGFNNDWDLTSGLLLYLLSISGIQHSPKSKRCSSIEEVISYLKIKSSKSYCPMQNLLKKKHLPSFLRKVKSKGGGLRGVRQTLGSLWDGWLYQNGDLDKENLVKRIFQEIYLGEKFTPCYQLQPLFYNGKGLYLNESLLIPKKILSTLRSKLRMGIATGRPKFDAELTLKHFRLLPYFDCIVTLDDCLEEEARVFRTTGKRIICSKPYPYTLSRVVQEIGLSRPRCGYVGDMVDDMLAVLSVKNKLQILAIGFLNNKKKRKIMEKSLFRAGADWVIKNPEELLQLIPNNKLEEKYG